MSLVLTQSKTALAPGVTASFLASGGTAPYTYAVLAGGAGGTIDSATGLYTAPSAASNDPTLRKDTFQVTDSLNATAQAAIVVAGPIFLFCDILQQGLGLADGRVFLWDQKTFQPSDSGLYVAVSVASCKPFGNVRKAGLVNGSPDWSQVEQSVLMMATLDIDIISRGLDALMRKEEVLLALNSLYSEAQQEGNSFSIGRLPAGSRFLNLSDVDGAAIPYRFRISVNMQYFVSKTQSADYIDTFQNVSVAIDS